jgi:HAE1 family hydrophobic/amphiphilic exporter-1
MFFALYSNNKDYDEVYIQNYAKINLVPKLQRVKGVGQVNVIGAKDYSMRIWIDPEKCPVITLHQKMFRMP